MIYWLENEKKSDLIASYLYDMDDQGQTHEVIKVTNLDEYRSLDDWVRHPPHVDWCSTGLDAATF